MVNRGWRSIILNLDWGILRKARGSRSSLTMLNRGWRSIILDLDWGIVLDLDRSVFRITLRRTGWRAPTLILSEHLAKLILDISSDSTPNLSISWSILSSGHIIRLLKVCRPVACLLSTSTGGTHSRSRSRDLCECTLQQRIDGITMRLPLRKLWTRSRRAILACWAIGFAAG